MPSTINGVGIRYCGKTNIRKRSGVCSHCGKESDLESYDTTKYFIILRLPIIPLKKVKVIDECSLCGRYRTLDQEQLSEARHKQLEETCQAWRDDPGDFEKANQALSAFASTRQFEGFNEFAAEVLKAFPDKVEAYETIGGIQAAFNMLDKALQTLTDGLSHQERHEGLRESIADLYIRKLEPEKAEPHLEHVRENGDEEKISFYYRLACAYQALAKHKQAIKIMDWCKAIDPELEEDNSYVKMRKQSENLLDTDTPVQHDWLVKVDEFKLSNAPEDTPLFARLLIPIILVVVCAIYLLIAWNAGNRDIYFVNGLSAPYTIEVNGASLTLAPHVGVKTRVHEGSVSWKITSGYPTIESGSIEIRTPFLSRPFNKTTFIVNPDKAAAIMHAESVYAPKNTSQQPPQANLNLLTGQTLYRLKNIDFIFEPFPESLDPADVGKNQSSWRAGDLLTDLPLSIAFQVMMQYSSPVKTRDWILARLQHERDNEEMLSILLNIAGPDFFMQTAQPFLKERPLLINWRRITQDLRDNNEDGEDVLNEYRELLDREPDNKSLQYLLARIEPDPDKSLELYLKASAEPDPCPYAYGALSLHYQASGDFARALPYTRKAVEFRKGVTFWRQSLINVLLGNGETNEAYERAKKIAAEEPGNIRYAAQAIQLQSLVEGLDAALTAIDAFGKEKTSIIGPENAAAAAMNMRCMAHYLNNSDECREIAVENQLPYWQMVLGVESGKSDPLDGLPVTTDSMRLEDQAVLYVHYSRKGLNRNADEMLQCATDQLSRGGKKTRILAELVNQADPQRVDEALAMIIEPELKTPAILMLSQRVPERGKDCLALALKLRTSKLPPTRIIQKWLEE